MNIENELKLIPTTGVTKEKVFELLKNLGINIPEHGMVIHQEDTYYDDKNGTLEKIGGSFRIRRKSDRVQVTCKLPIESDTEYKQRREYEITVPNGYAQDINMDLAIKLLRERYPELKFPENMKETVTVINDRNKYDIKCQDGTVLEMAFDSLHGRDENGILYNVRPEIELETLSGNPENLTRIYEEIAKTFPGQLQKNSQSKYTRIKNEVEYKKLTLNEIATCAMLSEILNSVEFNKLKEKGQVLHRYNRPTLTNLDNFRDFDYLIDRIAKIKSGEYKVAIPKHMARQERINTLLKNENFEIKDNIDLEDMFCLLLSDVPYQVADKVLADFLDKNYFEYDKATTNRLSHSQQVMLGTGLICKSSQVGADLYERLTAMVSALSHDIGHVPYSHIMEESLQEKIGSFSHDNNGAEVIEKIYGDRQSGMCNNIRSYYQDKKGDELNEEELQQILKQQKDTIQMAIREHSRTNSEQRGEGIIVQGPREADKIQYVVSDIRDLQQFFIDSGMEQTKFFSRDFIESALDKICAKKQYEYDNVKEKIYSLFINPIRDGKYGNAVVNVINTVKHSKYDDKEYYDVDQDLWKFIEQTIARTKSIRKESGIDNTRPAIKKMSSYIATRKLVGEYLGKHKGDREKARKAGLQDITNMGELDGLAYANDHILGLSKEELDRLKNGDYTQVTVQQLVAIRKKTYELLSRVLNQTGHGTKEELEELDKEVNNYGVKELIETYLNAPVITKMDEQKLGEFKVEDVQLKIVPNRKVTVTSILRAIGAKNEKYENYSFADFYFENNVPNKTLSLRIFHEKNRTQLRLKEKVAKKVSEIIRNTYEVEGDKQDTLFGLIEKLNRRYPGLNVEVAENDPYKKVAIQRLQWTFKGENGETIELREDTGESIDAKTKIIKPIHQIEIHGDAKSISKIKKNLIKIYGRKIFTQDTKEGGTKLQQSNSNPNGDENSGGDER